MKKVTRQEAIEFLTKYWADAISDNYDMLVNMLKHDGLQPFDTYTDHDLEEEINCNCSESEEFKII